MVTKTRFLMSRYLQHAKRSNSMFLYPAKRNKSNVKFLAQTEAQEVLKLSEGCKKKRRKDFDWFQCPWGPESLFRPQPSYCSHHYSKHAIPFCSYISYSSVQPLPPTGHPEACWNTMPVLAQAPTSGSNVEVTSLGKNGIVSVKSATLSKHSTAKKTNAEFRSKQNFSSNK